MKEYMKEALSFALDIGTRTVVGVVGYKDGEEFVPVDYECKAHEERAMVDGQIHDIQKVANVVYDVKVALEKRLGVSLKEVAIAAAGRALSTQIVTIKQHFDEIQEFNLSHIHQLELQGVEEAKEEQQKQNTSMDYFCVAYSVIQYYLDDYVITNLEGHKGQTIGAKIIGTFLPKQVIDSLYAVTERAELSVCHLTLEPIAAINAVIPEQIRMLNLALVDIGAGTSDIAITKEGSVVAYGMIPNAGDEVTESIIHKYLVDFKTAEEIKKQATVGDTIEFVDILGLPQQITSKELKKVISPAIDELAKQIAEKMIELNGGVAPNAIFCVGGGSQMLDVTDKIASYTKLSPQRVALRSTSNLVKVKDEIGMIDSPEMITPLGICMTSLQNKYSQFTFVSLNGKKVQLLNAKKLTILDAIVAMGIEHTSIFPKKGETLMFKLNGERKRLKGENGIPASILLNGEVATIHDHIHDGDVIEVEMGEAGKDGAANVKEYCGKTKQITLEGKKYILPFIKVNGRFEEIDYKILMNDQIEILEANTLKECLEILQIPAEGKLFTKHFEAIDLNYKLGDGDEILIDDYPHEIDDKLNKYEVEKECKVSVDHILSEEVTPTDQKLDKDENLYIIVNEKTVVLPPKETEYIFAGIFDFIDFDLSKPQGTVQLIRNGEPGALTDIIHDGDILKIYWKK